MTLLPNPEDVRKYERKSQWTMPTGVILTKLEELSEAKNEIKRLNMLLEVADERIRILEKELKQKG